MYLQSINFCPLKLSLFCLTKHGNILNTTHYHCLTIRSLNHNTFKRLYFYKNPCLPEPLCNALVNAHLPYSCSFEWQRCHCLLRLPVLFLIVVTVNQHRKLNQICYLVTLLVTETRSLQCFFFSFYSVTKACQSYLR